MYSYGNSSLRLGIALLSPKSGSSLGTTGDGWTHTVYTITPGIPGDSGSAMLDALGRGSGVLSTINYLPTPLSNGFGDLQHLLAYARTHGMGERGAGQRHGAVQPEPAPLRVTRIGFGSGRTPLPD